MSTVELRKDRWELPVTLSDGAAYRVVAYLYHPGSPGGRPLQVAVHGATYDHRYWDFPAVAGREYSYAAYMVERGHAVLALDCLAAGESDRPDGDFLTLEELAASVKQVVAAARSGANPSRATFGRIALVGHSLGAIAATYARSTGAEADVLVSTGMNHTPHAWPIDQEIVASLLAEPYAAFPPELRAAIFYYPGNSDPAVVAADNRLFSGGVVSRGLMLSALLRSFDSSATLVGEATGEVLVQIGENDVLFPGSMVESEAQHWIAAAEVEVQGLPAVGHCFNLHLDHERGWRRIHEFLQERLEKPGR